MSYEIRHSNSFTAGIFVGKAPLRPVRDYISGLVVTPSNTEDEVQARITYRGKPYEVLAALDGNDVYVVAIGDADVAGLISDIRQAAGTDESDRPDIMEVFRREVSIARVMESMRVIQRQ